MLPYTNLVLYATTPGEKVQKPSYLKMTAHQAIN